MFTKDITIDDLQGQWEWKLDGKNSSLVLVKGTRIEFNQFQS